MPFPRYNTPVHSKASRRRCLDDTAGEMHCRELGRTLGASLSRRGRQSPIATRAVNRNRLALPRRALALLGTPPVIRCAAPGPIPGGRPGHSTELWSVVMGCFELERNGVASRVHARRCVRVVSPSPVSVSRSMLRLASARAMSSAGPETVGPWPVDQLMSVGVK
jgi:hypothetical protein